MLAFERGHARAFAESRPTLIKIRHLGGLNRFVATIIIEDQQALVRNDLVFVEQLFGAGKIPLGIDMLDVDFSFASVLIFRQQILHVRSNRRGRGKEDRDAHPAF